MLSSIAIQIRELTQPFVARGRSGYRWQAFLWGILLACFLCLQSLQEGFTLRRSFGFDFAVTIYVYISYYDVYKALRTMLLLPPYNGTGKSFVWFLSLNLWRYWFATGSDDVTLSVKFVFCFFWFLHCKNLKNHFYCQVLWYSPLSSFVLPAILGTRKVIRSSSRICHVHLKTHPFCVTPLWFRLFFPLFFGGKSKSHSLLPSNFACPP